MRVCYDRGDPQRVMVSYDTTPAVFWIFGIASAVVLLVGIIFVAIAVWTELGVRNAFRSRFSTSQADWSRSRASVAFGAPSCSTMLGGTRR